jgi:hypothetical protein
MTTPRQPPKAAPVGTKTTPPVAQPTKDAKAPSAKEQAEAAQTKPVQKPAQGEVEHAEGKEAPASTRVELTRQWDDEGMLNSIVRGDHFLKNPTNYYNNLTYHWRLYCMPDRDFLYEGDPVTTIHEFYERLDKYEQVIIAESGVTGYTITDVELNSVFGDAQARGSQPTEITMKILEPNGVSFLDALQTAATAAGIHNFIDFYYYLELTFLGYDEEGNEVTNPFNVLPQNQWGVDQNLPNGGRWIWAVCINDIEVNLNSGGGEYKLTMLPKDEKSLDSEYANSVDTMLVSGHTVGEFFKNLSHSLNESWNRRLALSPKSEGYVTHEFQFHGIPPHGNPPSMARKDAVQKGINTEIKKIVDAKQVMDTDEVLDRRKEAADQAGKIHDQQTLFANGITEKQIRDMILAPENKDYNNLRTQQGFAFVDPTPASQQTQEQIDDGEEPLPPDEADIPTANIGRGTPIAEIINSIMSTCENAQQLARDSTGDGRTADESPESINPKSFRECVSWHIIPEVRYNKKGKWKYDFFTNRYGRHIVWHVYPRIDQEPILSHKQIRDAFAEDTGKKVQEGTLAALAARGFLPKRYDYLFTGLNTEVLNFDLNFNFAWSVMLPRFQSYYHDQNLQHAKVNPLTRLDLIDEHYDRERMAWRERATEHDKAARERGNGKHIDDADQDKEHDEIVAKGQRINELELKRNQAYREAVEERNKAVNAIDNETKDRVIKGSIEQDYQRSFVERYMDEERKQDRKGSRIPLVPFSFAAGDQPRQEVGLGQTGQWHNGRQLYGAVLNQAYGTVTGRFQQIELNVRGDPFWIGAGCFEQAIQHNNEAVVDRARQAYHFLGQNSFMFRFKYPTDVDESGTVVLKDNETVTGIYKVIKVKNSFSNGMFTQTLEAIRLPLIDLFASVLGIDSTDSGEELQPTAIEQDKDLQETLRSVDDVYEEEKKKKEEKEALAASAAEKQRQNRIAARESEKIRRESNGSRSVISGPKI